MALVGAAAAGVAVHQRRAQAQSTPPADEAAPSVGSSPGAVPRPSSRFVGPTTFAARS